MFKIVIKYGLLLFASLMVFFLLMHAFGQSDQIWLRIFNGVIHVGILYAAISTYANNENDRLQQYMKGVSLGLLLSCLGSLLFGIFIASFMALNPAFASSIGANLPLSEELLPIGTGLFVLVEGVVAGLIGSYIVTRYINMKMTEDIAGDQRYATTTG